MNLIKHLIFSTTAMLIVFICVSCQKSEKEIETSYLNSAIMNLKINKIVKWIVILPGAGCHGCIQEGESFMKKYIENNEVIFLLTEVSSLKILQEKTGIKLKEHSNIYVDYKNEIVIPTDNRIYPCIIHLKNGKIIDYEFQSPDNGNAFRKLEKLIMSK